MMVLSAGLAWSQKGCQSGGPAALQDPGEQDLALGCTGGDVEHQAGLL